MQGPSSSAVYLCTANQGLQGMKFEMVEPGLKIQYVPDQDAIRACEDFGRKIAEAMQA